MPDAISLAKAELWEVISDAEKIYGEKIAVQFNPETLNVTFANHVVQPGCAGDQSGIEAQQFVGSGTTRLSVRLWFDVNAPQTREGGAVDDVRKLTKEVIYFITPREQNQGEPEDEFIPPVVRFIWGTFQFDGIMDSLTESLEFFSSAGIPLRASVTFSLSHQKTYRVPRGRGTLRPGAGTTPLVQAPDGIPLQKITDRLSPGKSWQDIATANNIENPRILKAGSLIKVNNI